MKGAGLALSPGVIFAEDYRVVRHLAEGGMGAVYVVDQLSTGKARALKVMLPELAGDAELRRRFQQEARIGARIQSEHVVEIHSAGVDEETKAPFIVMELLTGEDLATRLERGGAFDAGAALELFGQLCHAVAAAHDAGIVHRDLKPENVFLATSKRAGQEGALDVKVLDFGIAKLVEESATRGATTVGMIGTPLWMAPEQTERGRVTPAADVWALGLILFRVLTGCHYWRSGGDESATYAQILKEVVMGPLPAASARARELGRGPAWPVELDVVFARSVTRDPVKRYQDARLFVAGLREVLARRAASRSSERIALVEAPSARIHAGAEPSIALERTAAVGAAPPPSPGVPVAPFGGALASPPMVAQPPALLASSHADVSALFGIPIRAVITTAGVLVALSGAMVVQCSRNVATQRLAEASREPSAPAILPVANGQHTSGLSAVGKPARCRLCTDSVTVTGSMPKDAVTSAVESALPRLEAQCVRAGGRRGSAAGVAALAFAVRDGRVSNRRVESSSSRDGVDECLVRALGEVTFPQTGSAEVIYALRYDPRAP